MSQMLFILSYMKGRATGTWATQKIGQVLQPTEMPLTFGEFEDEVHLMFADLNQEAMAWQKLTSLQQGTSSVNELIQCNLPLRHSPRTLPHPPPPPPPLPPTIPPPPPPSKRQRDPNPPPIGPGQLKG